MAHVILAGLEPAAEENLGRVLSDQGHQVTIGWQATLPAADALFCNGDDPAYTELVREVRRLRPNLPVVVVTGLPESAKWLDALEAGAADYCSAPFDTLQICWLLAAVLANASPHWAAPGLAPGSPSEPNQPPAGASNSPVLL